MGLNKTYIIKDKSIKDLLDSLNSIIINLSKLKNEYEHRIIINKNLNELWDAEINITNEKSKIKTVETVIESPTLL